MKAKKFLDNRYYRLSTFFIAAGLQCYAYAGFAVNTHVDETSAIYESPTTLVTKCVSKEQALDFYQKNQENNYQMVAAYTVNKNGLLSLTTASALEAFCINPYTHKIGVAPSSKEAMALAEARPQVFYAVAGETLSTTVTRWAHEQGDQVKWLAPNDFEIEVTYTFYGAFEQALNELLQSIANSSDSFAVKATIMKNGVVVIKENEYQAKPVIG